MALPCPRGHDLLKQIGSYLHGLSGLQCQIVEIDVIHLLQEGTHNIEECSARQACNGCESNLFNLGRCQTWQTMGQQFEKSVIPFRLTMVCILILLQFRSIRDERPSAIRVYD